MEKLRLSRIGNALMLHYVGEITLEITADLKRCLDAELEGDAVATVVVDLGDVTFMDSSASGFSFRPTPGCVAPGVPFTSTGSAPPWKRPWASSSCSSSSRSFRTKRP